MLDSNPFLVEEIIAARIAELHQQAENERLVAGGKEKKAGYVSRFLSAGGDFLRQAGQILPGRYAPDQQAEPVKAHAPTK